MVRKKNVEIPREHRDFIAFCASGLSAAEAFREAFRRTNPKLDAMRPNSVSGMACKLAKRYATEIEQERRLISEKVEAAKAEAIAQVQADGILSRAERMILLSKKAKGETVVEVERTVVIKGVASKVKINVYPTHAESIEAIRELNKMDGIYHLVKLEVEDKVEDNKRVDVEANKWTIVYEGQNVYRGFKTDEERVNEANN